MDAGAVQSNRPRYRAVRLARKSFNLKAAVEDTSTGETIRVANASMAWLLADLLNAEDAGDPLPPAGARHAPIRFQIFHTGPPQPGAGVMYVHRSSARVVAYAERDEVARHVGRLLNHVDYPMRERGIWLPPTAGHVGTERGELPQPSIEQGADPRVSRRARGWALLIALASLLPLAALVVLAALAFGWQVAAVFVAAWIGMLLILGWLSRR